MASISITYTPNYLGCHRIYFREPEATEYCLYIDESASVIGEPKTTVINLEGEYANCISSPEGIFCTNPSVEGYIQPCCAGENDEETKVPFSFGIAAETCNSYNITCTGSSIANIFMTDSGEGYLSTPVLFIQNAGSGTGFTAVVNMDGNIVDSVTITNPGNNYSPSSVALFVGGNPDRAATADVELCPCGTNCSIDAKVLVEDCIDKTEESIIPPIPGIPYVLCSNSLPVGVDTPNLIITSAPTSCCTCNSYSITNQDKARSLPIHYIDCNNVYQTAAIAALGVLVICAVTNSVGFEKDYPGNIISLGSCS